jgi:hypothetical protein
MIASREDNNDVDSALQQRIDAMLRRDIAVGVAFASAMWLTILFIFIMTARVVDDATVVVVLGASGAVLGIFNTLSLTSMISRYRQERHHVYGEDIAHLDAMRAAQQLSRTGVGA